ncbi:ribonuclease H-like domain-containing protein, partial [Tanacetum coccineum]
MATSRPSTRLLYKNHSASWVRLVKRTKLPHAFKYFDLTGSAKLYLENMDTGASSHLNSSVNNLSTIFNSRIYPSVLVGDGKSIPVTNTGHSTLPTPYRTLHLNNVLITPNIVKNLISTVKARLVAIWLHKLAGIDVDEIFRQAFVHGSGAEKVIHCYNLVSGIRSIQIMFAFFNDLFMGLNRPLGPGFREFAAYAARMVSISTKAATEVLDRAGMLNYKPCRTPVDTDSKLSADGAPISDSTLYRSLAGALQYLTFTRPDISYAVQHVCLFMHNPQEPHLSALKRILRCSQDLEKMMLRDVSKVGRSGIKLTRCSQDLEKMMLRDVSKVGRSGIKLTREFPLSLHKVTRELKLEWCSQDLEKMMLRDVSKVGRSGIKLTR